MYAVIHASSLLLFLIHAFSVLFDEDWTRICTMKLTHRGSWFVLAVDAVQSRSHELSITFSLLLICPMAKMF